MAALVDFSSNFNLTTGAYWHLQFRKPGGLFMTANLKKCPREGIFEMNSPLSQKARIKKTDHRGQSGEGVPALHVLSSRLATDSSHMFSVSSSSYPGLRYQNGERLLN